jgi:hypothetical protein
VLLVNVAYEEARVVGIGKKQDHREEGLEVFCWLQQNKIKKKIGEAPVSNGLN